MISPLLSNLYLNEVDKMLERAKEVTRNGKYTYLEYARYADDLVILVDAYPRHDWLLRAVDKRLREELAKLHVEINEEKSRVVDLGKGESFGFLGFEFRRVRSLRGVLAAGVRAQAEEADGAAAEAQGHLPTLSIPAGGAGGGTHQPDPAWLGELLCRRAFESVLRLRQGLGGEEGAAAPDARPGAAGLRLGQVE